MTVYAWGFRTKTGRGVSYCRGGRATRQVYGSQLNAAGARAALRAASYWCKASEGCKKVMASGRTCAEAKTAVAKKLARGAKKRVGGVKKRVGTKGKKRTGSKSCLARCKQKCRKR